MTPHTLIPVSLDDLFHKLCVLRQLLIRRDYILILIVYIIVRCLWFSWRNKECIYVDDGDILLEKLINHRRAIFWFYFLFHKGKISDEGWAGMEAADECWENGRHELGVIRWRRLGQGSLWSTPCVHAGEGTQTSNDLCIAGRCAVGTVLPPNLWVISWWRRDLRATNISSMQIIHVCMSVWVEQEAIAR